LERTQYHGVFKSNTSENTWMAYLTLPESPVKVKSKYLGTHETEIAAAKHVNAECRKHGMELKNPQVYDENTISKYSGVSWINEQQKWQARLFHNNIAQYGGLFDNEKHAAMKVNLICDKYEIERKSPMIMDIEPNIIQQAQFKINQTRKYKGICWLNHCKKWKARLFFNNKAYDGGSFDNEDHAAMSVNFLCDKLQIERKNPMLNIKMNAIQWKMQKDVMKLNQEDLVVLTITTFAPQLFIFINHHQFMSGGIWITLNSLLAHIVSSFQIIFYGRRKNFPKFENKNCISRKCTQFGLMWLNLLFCFFVFGHNFHENYALLLWNFVFIPLTLWLSYGLKIQEYLYG